LHQLRSSPTAGGAQRRNATAASGGAAATSGAKSRPDQRPKEGGDFLVVKQHETGG